jgi:hypothetical protein
VDRAPRGGAGAAGARAGGTTTPAMIDARGPVTAGGAVRRPEAPITPLAPAPGPAARAVPAPVVHPRPQVVPLITAARPRIEPEPAILGLSRHSRSRLGSRLFTLFFVGIFTLILVQLVWSLLTY